jgi:hypothetical protein
MNVERITLTEIDDGVKMTVGTGTQEATEIDIPWRLVLWLRDKLTVAAFETSVGLSMRPLDSSVIEPGSATGWLLDIPGDPRQRRRFPPLLRSLRR